MPERTGIAIVAGVQFPPFFQTGRPESGTGSPGKPGPCATRLAPDSTDSTDSTDALNAFNAIMMSAESSNEPNAQSGHLCSGSRLGQAFRVPVRAHTISVWPFDVWVAVVIVDLDARPGATYSAAFDDAAAAFLVVNIVVAKKPKRATLELNEASAKASAISVFEACASTTACLEHFESLEASLDPEPINPAPFT